MNPSASYTADEIHDRTETNTDAVAVSNIADDHKYKDYKDAVDEIFAFAHTQRTPFPARLHKFLSTVDDLGLSHIISWQPHGRCFVVHKPAEFEKEILPNVFYQTKFQSFKRQLNMYGFIPLKQGKDRGGYYHELFLRTKPFMSYHVKKTSKKIQKPNVEPDFYTFSFLPKDDEEGKARKQYNDAVEQIDLSDNHSLEGEKISKEKCEEEEEHKGKKGKHDVNRLNPILSLDDVISGKRLKQESGNISSITAQNRSKSNEKDEDGDKIDELSHPSTLSNHRELNSEEQQPSALNGFIPACENRSQQQINNYINPSNHNENSARATTNNELNSQHQNCSQAKSQQLQSCSQLTSQQVQTTSIATLPGSFAHALQGLTSSNLGITLNTNTPGMYYNNNNTVPLSSTGIPQVDQLINNNNNNINPILLQSIISQLSSALIAPQRQTNPVALNAPINILPSSAPNLSHPVVVVINPGNSAAAPSTAIQPPLVSNNNNSLSVSQPPPTTNNDTNISQLIQQLLTLVRNNSIGQS